MLNELKTELEYCRKKWALARALNSESEEQCKQLRHEFSMRKIQDQNSAESGYSDEHPSDGDADEDEAGTSQKPLKVKKFDENLLMFDRTASPTSSERRKSESPLIHDFTILCVFSRAQSEPPGISCPDTDDIDAGDSEVFEVLDLIPDPVQDRCAVTVSEECGVSAIAREKLVVTPPPQIHVHNPPRLKAHLRKHKKDKIKKSGTAETAEDMFNRLLGLTKDECSTCTCSTSVDEDEGEVHENIEEIQEIPLDEEAVATCSEHCEPSTSSPIEIEEPPMPEKAVEVDPQPSTSRSDVSALTVKEQEYLQRREARLARLEAESQAFYDRMAKNKDKGRQLNDHLNDIHQTFLDRNRERKKSEDEKTTDEASTSSKDDKEKQPEDKSEEDGK